MDPMMNAINSLGTTGLPGGGAPAPAAPSNDPSGFMQPAQSMFGTPPAAPAAAPQMPAAPAYAPAAPQPQIPSWQQPAQQPPAPGQAPQQYAPQMPIMPPMPGMPPQMTATPPGVPPMPQFPSQQQSDTPAWAQQLMQSVQQLQGGGQQDGGGQQPAGFNPDEPWSATNRPRSWEEMRRYNESLSTKKAQEIVTQTLQQQQQQQIQQQQAEARTNQEIDQTLDRLRLNGVLPPIQNPNDPNDPGKQAERELIGYTVANGGKTPQDMLYAAPALYQRHQIGQFYDVKANQMVQRRGMSPGAYAPIAGGTPVMGAMGGQQPGVPAGLLASGSISDVMQYGMAQTEGM